MRTLDAWKKHGEGVLLICGPKGSGKSHLLRIIETETAGGSPATHCRDDVSHDFAPAELLIAIESAREKGERLVLAGAGDPAEWAGGLRDLETRLGAAPRITLVDPDEALLKAVLTKQFRDRQLRASEAIIDYAAPRLPKTFAAVRAFAAALDALSIEKGEAIGLKLAREVVNNLSEEAFEA